MKKMLYTLAYLLQDVLNRRLLFKTNRPAVAPENHHPSFLRFWNWAKKTVDAAKICGGAENIVKTKTQQTFVNGLLRFYYFRHLYSAGKRNVYYSTIIA